MNPFNESLARIVHLVLPKLLTPVPERKDAVPAQLKELLQATVESLGDPERGWNGTIYLQDTINQKLLPVACIGKAACETPERDSALESGMISAAVQQKQVQCVQHMGDNGRNGPQEIGSRIAVPLLLQNEIVGVLSLAAPVPDAFTPAAVEFLTQVAGFGALLVRQEQQEIIRRERELYLDALYALKKKELLNQPPIQRTPEDILHLENTSATLEEVLEELAAEGE